MYMMVLLPAFIVMLCRRYNILYYHAIFLHMFTTNCNTRE